ncbi:hypothetical protein [Lacrimispora sp.]
MKKLLNFALILIMSLIVSMTAFSAVPTENNYIENIYNRADRDFYV